MYSHSNVFVDVAALQIEQIELPRAVYMRHLRGLVEAGFGKRIMFGSDFPLPGGPRAADYPQEGVDAILAADFLTAEQQGRHPVRQRGTISPPGRVGVSPLKRRPNMRCTRRPHHKPGSRW